ncbi:hypothetical protein GCM10023196_074590 [Actinoallomurus vinaceus]|uniref:MMPL family transporter n=1 Tax=Actinoallomurus vinaceus TaxID=1080074 RepID=A0ABP8UND3_9ACTN
MGVGVNGRTSSQQRLLTLLAGFFGFVMTAVLAAIPGTAVADVMRAGGTESANTAGTGGSAATVASLDRGRRSARTAVAADTARILGRGTPAHVVPPEAPDTAAAQATARDVLRFAAAGAHHAGVVVLPVGTGAGEGRRVADVIAARSVAPPAVFTSAVRLRGPPPGTGS